MLNFFPSSSCSCLTIQNPNKLSSLESITPTCLNPNTSALSSSTTTKPSSQNLSFKCRHSNNYFEQQQQQQRFAPKPPPTNDSKSGQPRVFVGHSVYKGKAALTVEPRPPEFSALDSGAFKLTREGYVLLQFAPAAGVRQYDWGRKQVFSLSVTEIGTLIGLGARDSCEFFHDPFKGKRSSVVAIGCLNDSRPLVGITRGYVSYRDVFPKKQGQTLTKAYDTSDEGKVRKVLKVEPLPDGTGHFFNLSWHTFANSIKPDDNIRVNNANPRSGADFEWSR
ncbi:hypothetical protein HYC85_015506 [Camellia sinensis]|uniref:Uncharacterized protein n=1 Tax=Camellia sinensis TaxID=4442 RepID=A0A7J7H0U2_CAMSI|nr:hypothetical protein HYC85_015506 [Camellia sinensis]